MWGLIVSLLFLTPILDGFQALDDAGRPLPGAVLTFLRPGTTVPKPVYTDQELDTELSDNRGRVVADEEGRFPLIYLAYDPTPRYRVMLHTAEGVLRWDIDPYLCDCTDPPYLFRGPKHQTLDESGRPLAGARLIFSITETETPARTYADAELTVPHPNPLVADSGGFFPPVYLDDDITYRVRLTDRRGELLLDVDPYVCECGMLLLTSKAYAYEHADSAIATGAAIPKGGAPWFESIVTALAGRIALGEMREPVITYDQWPPEAVIGTGAAVDSGEMREPIITYDEWPPESVEAVGAAIDSGSMIAPIVTYQNWPPEAVEATGGAIESGTMTT